MTINENNILNTKSSFSQDEFESYKLLFDNMNEGFILHEVILNEKNEPIDFLFLYGNKAMLKQIGLDIEVIANKRVLDFFPNMDEDLLNLYYEVALNGISTKRDIYSEHLKKHIMLSIFSPKYRFVAVVFYDITEQKQKEIDLKKSKSKYKYAINATSEVIWEYNVKTGIYFISHKFYNILGYQEGELELNFNSLKTLSHKDDFQNLIQLIKRFRDYNSSTAYQAEVRMLHKTNGYIWILIKGNVVERNEKGEPTLYSGTMNDISERKKNDELLYFIKYSLDFISDVIIWLDANGFIRYANKTFSTFYKYTPEEIPNLTIFDLNPNLDYNLWGKLWHELLISKTLNLETIHKDKNGNLFPVELSVTKIEFNLTTYHCVLIRDISELKKINKELLAAKEHAEESDRLKSSFIQNISHEVRTPLNGIIGFSGLLLNPNIDQSSMIENAQFIFNSGKRLLSLIDNVLLLSTIDSSQQKFTPVAISLNDLIQNVCLKIENLIRAKNLKLIFENNDISKNISIESDENKLTNILNQLLLNAITFTDSGTITIKYELQESNLEISISDTGKGIAKDNIPHIFNRFYQVEDALNKHHDGVGLGLSIVKSFVEFLNGEILVESDLGVGSKFIFKIPVKLTENSTKQIKNKILEKAKNVILIVEDDIISLRLFEKIIGNWNYKVLTTTDGNIAINIFKDNPDIAFVLLDIKIPNLDGFGVARELKKINKDVYIVGQSAFVNIESKHTAFEAGCDAFLEKPIDIMELKQIINDYFKN